MDIQMNSYDESNSQTVWMIQRPWNEANDEASVSSLKDTHTLCVFEVGWCVPGTFEFWPQFWGCLGTQHDAVLSECNSDNTKMESSHAESLYFFWAETYDKYWFLLVIAVLLLHSLLKTNLISDVKMSTIWSPKFPKPGKTDDELGCNL